MFLNTDAKPFWGGTYFPPHRKYNRPGFKEVLITVADAFHNNNDQILTSSREIDQIIRNDKFKTEDQATGALNLPKLNLVGEKLLAYLDPRQGGTAGSPKFPQPNLLSFIWKTYERTQDTRYRSAFLLALQQMSKGGIYDHLGGGYSRYSTDEY